MSLRVFKVLQINGVMIGCGFRATVAHTRTNQARSRTRAPYIRSLIKRFYHIKDYFISLRVVKVLQINEVMIGCGFRATVAHTRTNQARSRTRAPYIRSLVITECAGQYRLLVGR